MSDTMKGKEIVLLSGDYETRMRARADMQEAGVPVGEIDVEHQTTAVYDALVLASPGDRINVATFADFGLSARDLAAVLIFCGRRGVRVRCASEPIEAADSARPYEQDAPWLKVLEMLVGIGS